MCFGIFEIGKSVRSARSELANVFSHDLTETEGCIYVYIQFEGVERIAVESRGQISCRCNFERCTGQLQGAAGICEVSTEIVRRKWESISVEFLASDYSRTLSTRFISKYLVF